MKIRGIDFILTFYIFFVLAVVLIFGSPLSQMGLIAKYLVFEAIIVLFIFVRAKDYLVKNKIAKGIIKFLSNWYYVIICILFYSSLPLINRLIFGQYFDDHIVALEKFVFGSLPALWLKHALPSKILMEAVHVGYFAYYIFIPMLGIPLYLRKDKVAFDHFIFTICLTFISCYIVYVIYPVSGPCFIFEEASVGDLQGYLFTKLTVLLHDGGAVRAAAFPSSHVGVATTFILLAYRYHKTVFKIGLPLVISLFFGTFYPSYHFVVDAIAGLIYGSAIFMLSFPLHKYLTKFSKTEPTCF